MSDILTERSDGILRVQFNRPEKKNAMTASMYTQLADILNESDEDESSSRIRPVPGRTTPFKPFSLVKYTSS